RGCQGPLACQGLHPFEVLGPIVQCRRIKVCAIGPHQRLDLRIELDLVEERGIPEGAVQLALKDGRKINHLGCRVIECHTQRVRCHDGKGHYTVNGMDHDLLSHCNGVILWGGCPDCSRSQFAKSSSWCSSAQAST